MEGDAALVERLRAGDEAAFAVLVGRYQAQLLRLAETFVPSRAVAEEVVQDTWLGVFRGIERFEGRSSLKTWLFRILANRARTTGGREPKSVPLSVEPAEAPAQFHPDGPWRSPVLAWSDAADDRIVAEQLAARVQAFLPELPGAQRQVLVLRDMEGLAPADVCAVMGISDGNQRVLLHRARARVRALLATELVEN